jgi:hypothetical protein
MKPEVQLDRQIQGDTWQRSTDSEKGVSGGNKGGGCNIVGARSGEGLARGYNPWSHRRKSLV